MVTFGSLRATRAAPQAPRVIVLHEQANGTDAASQLHQNFTRRTISELRAQGFEALQGTDTAEHAPDQALSKLRDLNALAFILLRTSSDHLRAELWIRDEAGERLLVQRLERPASDDAAVIVALQVVERLEANLIDLDVLPAPEARRPEAPRAAPVPATEAEPGERARETPPALPPDAREERHVSTAVGPALLLGPGGIPPSPALSVAVAWYPASSLALELWAAAALGVTTTQGSASADVTQRLGLIGVRWDAWRHGAWLLLLSGSGGAYQIAAEGEASEPLRGADVRDTVLALAVALRVELEVTNNVTLTSGTQVLWLEPRPVLRFADSVAAKSAAPMFAPALQIGASW